MRGEDAKNIVKEAAEALSLGRTRINEKERWPCCGTAKTCQCQADMCGNSAGRAEERSELSEK